MTTSVLTIRLSQEERAILKAASELARTNLSEFIRRRHSLRAKRTSWNGALSPFRRTTGKRSKLGHTGRRTRPTGSKNSRPKRRRGRSTALAGGMAQALA